MEKTKSDSDVFRRITTDLTYLQGYEDAMANVRKSGQEGAQRELDRLWKAFHEDPKP